MWYLGSTASGTSAKSKAKGFASKAAGKLGLPPGRGVFPILPSLETVSRREEACFLSSRREEACFLPFLEEFRRMF